MKLLSPQHWKDYELIDSGDFEKLERFGEYVLIRPEPQAIWKKNLTDSEWRKRATGRFNRDSEKSRQRTGPDDGWKFSRKVSETWWISYQCDKISLGLRLAFTSFGHVGVFPEQANNWNFIASAMGNQNDQGRVLNLFGYTGAASIVARSCGADVTHVDAVKSVNNWGRENEAASGVSGIRWVTEDAMKFIQREVNRGNRYMGIILDPPAYGRGPNGEKWVLEEGLRPLLECCAKLLDKNGFLVLSMYSMGFSSLVPVNIIQSIFGERQIEFGEFFLKSSMGQQLPMGTFLRFES